MEPSFRAQEFVESHLPSGASSDKALEKLKARLGKDEFLIEVYARDLLGLVLK